MATDGVSPFLQVTFPVSPAAMVALPSKSHMSGAAPSHSGSLAGHIHAADTPLVPPCKKRKGIMLATAAPNTVATMLRIIAMPSAKCSGCSRGEQLDKGASASTQVLKNYKP